MEEVKRNSLKAWLLAARPKTLTGAITPVLIGTALAAMDGRFHWLPALVCCLFAGLMQIAANFINDLFDFLKGTDREDRLGPERACAQGWISPQAMKNRNCRYRHTCLPDRLHAITFCRMGVDHHRSALCIIRLPLHYRTLSPLLQRLGRRVSHHFLRICSRRRNLLRAGTDVDTGCHHRLHHLRTINRHTVSCQ